MDVKKIQLWIAIAVGSVMLFGVGYKLDCRWAKPSWTDHEVLAGDVRGMKQQNTVELIYQIEREYKGIPQHQWPTDTSERYKSLQRYLKCLDEGKKDCRYRQQ